MKNKEKFAKEIVEIAIAGHNIAFDKENGKLRACKELTCDECAFRHDIYSCDEKIKKWAESEYVEKIKLTQAEKAILESIDRAYEWIARDKNGGLYIYDNKPSKDENNESWDLYRIDPEAIYCDLSMFSHLFQFIEWEDEEPYNIQWLLENSEVE